MKVRMYFRSIGYFIAVMFLIVGGGCGHSNSTQRTPYLSDYSYSPKPELLTIFNKEQKPAVDVRVSVMGIVPSPDGLSSSVEVRIRFENKGPATMSFDPHGMLLTSGSLQPFSPPQVATNQPLQLTAGQTGTLVLLFPAPPGVDIRSMGLNALRLQWQVLVDNNPVPQFAYFMRSMAGY